MIHGTKKQKKQKTQQQIQEEDELSSKINSKLADFFSIRSKPYTDDQIPKYMEFTALLIQLCSDIPTIFNFRRQLLERAISINQNELQKTGQLLLREVKLNTKLIRDDPKSYTLWSFRQWLIQKIYQVNKSIVNQEKQLCKVLLTKDEKNFHVWNYRNWVNSVQLNIDEQLAFTEQKIKSNPFNFSPYHFRSKYLPLKYLPLLKLPQTSYQKKKQILKYGMPKLTFQGELQTVKTAIYLNPNEQAPWIYYRWLLKRVVPVIILSSKQQNDIHTLVLSERVHNFDRFVTLQGENSTLNTQKLSNVWRFRSQSGPSSLDLENNKNQFSHIETDGIQKSWVYCKNQDLDKIREIFTAEQAYIKQILSQEEHCRFANLQLLQILKNQLSMASSSQQMGRIVAQGKKVFEQLDNQVKTKQQIQKLKQYWLRMAKAQTLHVDQNMTSK